MARGNFGIPSTGLPGNLYSGGAVTFNSQPYINYYLQQQAHKQAQEDAMYRYFGEMGKGLTPSGMDGKDIPGLMQRKNDWRSYMLQNRKAIARPGIDQGQAYGEAMGRYNDMLDYINRSKSKVKNLASLGPILHSPQKDALLNDSTQLRIQNGSLPLDHPNYKEFDPTSISYNPPPFDSKAANNLRILMGQYKPTETSPTITPLPNHQQKVEHNFQFNPSQLQGIYSQAAVQYHTDPRFKNMIDSEDGPDTYHSMNDLFKQHYGRDIASKEDMSTAYMLSLHPDISNKFEVRNVPVSPWESAAASLGREEDYYNYRQNQGGQTPDAAEKFLSGQEAIARKGQVHSYTHADTGTTEDTYDVKLTDPQVQKVFGRRDVTGKHMIVPDEVQVLKNGDYLPIYYEYKNGQPVKGENGKVAVDSRYTKPVSRDAVKASLVSNKLVPKEPSSTPAGNVTHKKTTFGSGGLN